MFSKTAKASDEQMNSGADPKSSAPSIISANLKIVGDLHSDGELHVDGVVEGDIRSKALLVGESAKVTGAIVADDVRVLGSVTGQIRARSVHLAKSAQVRGDVVHEELAIERGAFIEGHCSRIDSKKEAGEAKINLVVKEQATTGPRAEVANADSTQKQARKAVARG